MLPLLNGREKFVRLEEPLIEYSEVIDGDRWIGCTNGEKGDCGRDILLLPENFLDEDTAYEPFTDASSSPLSGGTDRMLCMLLGDLGNAGDRGGASERCDLVDPFVKVRGCVDCTESTLFVKLGIPIGDAACTLIILGSTGSGEEALGAAMPK